MSRMATPPHRKLKGWQELTEQQRFMFDLTVARAAMKHRGYTIEKYLRDAKQKKTPAEAVTAGILAMMYVEGM